MKRLHTAALAALLLCVQSCLNNDFGPEQHQTKSFSVIGFDRIEASNAFDITIQQGSTFSIQAAGDRRDIDDLNVSKIGSTLMLNYVTSSKRQYQTFITITMPALLEVDFAGGVNARMNDFTAAVDRFDASLSGGSVAQLQLNAAKIHILVTGGSVGTLTGGGTSLDASVSGASVLTSLDYPVAAADLIVTGASTASVAVSSQLTASASGASEVIYRGTPELETDTSGESTVHGE